MRPDPTERPAVSWRLLVEPAADGAENMAADEALLDAYLAPGGRDACPTLRLYGWKPATLSLGKAQAASGSHDPRYLADQCLGLVRRPTGGHAVLHERERTYSVVGRLDLPPFDRGVLATYAAISEALRFGLATLGLETAAAVTREPGERASGPVCFNSASAHELLHRGRKVVGSAQMRRRRAFLQHGSIPFHTDPERLGAAIGAPADGGRFTALTDLLGRTPTTGELDRALIAGFERRFKIDLVPGRRTEWERQRIEGLRCWKYLSKSWTYRGRIGRVERARAPHGLFHPPSG